MPSPLKPDSRRFVADAARLLAEGRAEQALEVCDAGLQLHPQYLPAFMVLAKALLALGEPEDAAIWLDALLERSPNHYVASRLRSILGTGVDSRSRGDVRIQPLGSAVDAAIGQPPQVVDGQAASEAAQPGPGAGPSQQVSSAIEAASSDESTDDEEPVGHVGRGVEARKVGEQAHPPRPRGEEPVDGPVEAEMVSETLGDLYARQGDTASAIRIYTRVLQRADSARVRQKLKSMGADAQPAMAQTQEASVGGGIEDPRLPALRAFLEAMAPR